MEPWVAHFVELGIQIVTGVVIVAGFAIFGGVVIREFYRGMKDR